MSVANEEQKLGVNIAVRAMEEPFRQIVTNAGLKSSVVLSQVRQNEGTYGFNAQSEQYGDMLDMGILDPTKVTRTALQNAASIAGLMLTTEAMVADAPSKQNAETAATGAEWE